MLGVSKAIRMRAHERDDAGEALRLPARGDIDQHHGIEQRVFGLRHQPSEAAHRGANPQPWRSHRGGDGMQVGDPLLGLVALRWRVAATFAMAAGLKAQRRIAFSDQAAGGALPRLSGLPATTKYEERRERKG